MHLFHFVVFAFHYQSYSLKPCSFKLDWILCLIPRKSHVVVITLWLDISLMRLVRKDWFLRHVLQPCKSPAPKSLFPGFQNFQLTQRHSGWFLVWTLHFATKSFWWGKSGLFSLLMWHLRSSRDFSHKLFPNPVSFLPAQTIWNYDFSVNWRCTRDPLDAKAVRGFVVGCLIQFLFETTSIDAT